MEAGTTTFGTELVSAGSSRALPHQKPASAIYQRLSISLRKTEGSGPDKLSSGSLGSYD